LALGERNAGAHYVLALCRDGLGDLVGAEDNDRRAAALDPFFAMPRVHLGLLARRTKNYGAMRHELSKAVTLLETEDAVRVMLFGGGFSRRTLIALCRAEMERDRCSCA
jgi:chemotaxis protein methyltransferase CheR